MSGASILILLVLAFIAFKVVKGVVGFIFKIAVLGAMVVAFVMWKQGGL
jgi:hypothetical protein